MAINDSQKIDVLWKKLGFGKSETDIAKKGFNEIIDSPLPTFSKDVWNQAELIPVPPVIGVGEPFITQYETIRCSVDTSVSGYKTWFATDTYGDLSTRLSDWVPPTFSPEYLIEVYDDNPATTGVQIFQTTENEEWFFDYISGIIHFPNTVPAGVLAVNELWIRGYHYIGDKGVGSGSGGSSNWAVISSNYNAVDGDALLADTSGGSFDVTLPGTPSTYDTVTIVPLYPTYDVNPLTVKTFGGALPIAGVMDDLVIDQLGCAVQLTYIDMTIGWAVIKQGDVNLINIIDDSGVGVYFRLTEGWQTVPSYPSHYHSVTVSNTQMLNMLQGLTPSVVVASSMNMAHTHNVTVAYSDGYFTVSTITSNHTTQQHYAEFAEYEKSLVPWKVITSNYTAKKFDRIVADSVAFGSFSITLPLNPDIGSRIQVAPLYPSYVAFPVTILRNGELINGSADDVLLDQNDISIELFFVGGTTGWVLMHKGETTVFKVVEANDFLPNSIRAVKHSFDETDAGTFNIGAALPVNSIVTSVRIFVTSAFNAGTPTLEIGSTQVGYEDAIADGASNDLLSTGLNMVFAYFNVGVIHAQLMGTLTLNGATSGSGEILIEYYVE